MSKKIIEELVRLLPEHLLIEALCQHIRELGKAGEMEKAENLLKSLSQAKVNSECLPVSVRYLIKLNLDRNGIDAAIRLYGNFPECQDVSCISEKLMSCHLLVHALLSKDLERAFRIWADLSPFPGNSALKWHWIQTGLALLEQCYKNSQGELARSIVMLLHQFGECERSSAFIARADEIAKKMGLV